MVGGCRNAVGLNRLANFLRLNIFLFHPLVVPLDVGVVQLGHLGSSELLVFFLLFSFFFFFFIYDRTISFLLSCFFFFFFEARFYFFLCYDEGSSEVWHGFYGLGRGN